MSKLTEDEANVLGGWALLIGILCAFIAIWALAGFGYAMIGAVLFCAFLVWAVRKELRSG